MGRPRARTGGPRSALSSSVRALDDWSTSEHEAIDWSAQDAPAPVGQAASDHDPACRPTGPRRAESRAAAPSPSAARSPITRHATAQLPPPPRAPLRAQRLPSRPRRAVGGAAGRDADPGGGHQRARRHAAHAGPPALADSGAVPAPRGAAPMRRGPGGLAPWADAARLSPLRSRGAAGQRPDRRHPGRIRRRRRPASDRRAVGHRRRLLAARRRLPCRAVAADGEAACGGGIKALGDGLAEIKRFYVAPAFRGRGLARELLEALEDEARRLGHRTVRLDATRPTWPMFVTAGYHEVADYNGNPHATSGARSLDL